MEAGGAGKIDMWIGGMPVYNSPRGARPEPELSGRWCMSAAPGITTPDASQVTIFGSSPREAVADGRIGAMPQGGALLDDATVGETIGMIASSTPARRSASATWSR